TGLSKKTQQHDERRRRPAPPRACLARPREITRVADFRDFGSRCDHPPHSSESDGLASAAAPPALRPRLSSKLPLRMLMKTFDYVGIVGRRAEAPRANPLNPLVFERRSRDGGRAPVRAEMPGDRHRRAPDLWRIYYTREFTDD